MEVINMAEPVPEKYIIDSAGQRTHVVLRIEDYEHLIELVEDIEDLRDIKDRMVCPEFIDFEEVKKQLEL